MNRYCPMHSAKATVASVTVNSQSATLYDDYTFAKAGFSLSDGNNTFTAVAQDSLGRTTNSTGKAE